MTNYCKYAVAAIFMSLGALASAETTLIHAGELLAVPGQSPSSRQTIVVSDNQIVETRNGFASAADFEGDVTIKYR
jgi:hypothetical protein